VKSEEARIQSPAGAAAGEGKGSGTVGASGSLREAIRGAADKIRRFSLVQLWGLWLLALLLFLWILLRDWLV
jgi:hypothetical protein